MSAWEAVLGLEIHTQLATTSKIFSNAPTAYGAPANTQACAVDLGLPGVLPVGGREGDAVVGEVLWVDHFGNLQLNLDPDDLDGMDGALQIRAGDMTRPLERVSAYGQISAGAIGLLTDSYGLLSLAVQRGSAADELRIGESDQVHIAATGEPVGVTTPVELGRR